jgi:hypothetical protein
MTEQISSESLYVVKNRWRKNGEIKTSHSVHRDKGKAIQDASRTATPMDDNKKERSWMVSTVIESQSDFVNISPRGTMLTGGDELVEFDSRDREVSEILSEGDVVNSVGDEGVGIVKEVRDNLVRVQHKEKMEDYHADELTVFGYDKDLEIGGDNNV